MRQLLYNFLLAYYFSKVFTKQCDNKQKGQVFQKTCPFCVNFSSEIIRNLIRISHKFLVAYQGILKYNKSNEKKAWDVRHPAFLNLHLLLWDSYIFKWMSGHQYLCGMRAVEGRSLYAVTHLAIARSQKRRKRHFGFIRKTMLQKKIFCETKDKNTDEE